MAGDREGRWKELAEERLSELYELRSSSQAARQELEKELAQAEKQLKSERQQRSKAERDLTNIKNKYDEVMRQGQSDKSKLTSRIEKLEAENKQLKQKVTTLEDAQDDLERTTRQQEVTIEQLQDDLSDKLESLALVQGELEEMQDDKQHMKQALNDALEEASSLRDKLATQETAAVTQPQAEERRDEEATDHQCHDDASTQTSPPVDGGGRLAHQLAGEADTSHVHQPMRMSEQWHGAPNGNTRHEEQQQEQETHAASMVSPAAGDTRAYVAEETLSPHDLLRYRLRLFKSLLLSSSRLAVCGCNRDNRRRNKKQTDRRAGRQTDRGRKRAEEAHTQTDWQRGLTNRARSFVVKGLSCSGACALTLRCWFFCLLFVECNGCLVCRLQALEDQLPAAVTGSDTF